MTTSGRWWHSVSPALANPSCAPDIRTLPRGRQERSAATGEGENRAPQQTQDPIGQNRCRADAEEGETL